MRVSVFTPTHNPRYLRDAYESLRDQLGADDEWVILYNGGAQPVGFEDPRVKEITNHDLPPMVGALKRAAVEASTGDVCVELDHDDLLLPGAIDAVKHAFASRPDVAFVYSNCVNIEADGSPFTQWPAEEGWRYRRVDVEIPSGSRRWDGARDPGLYYPGWRFPSAEELSFDPFPFHVARIWSAPNHLRAFRRSAYDAAGGYDANMRVLDDQDLMCRLYLQGEFLHLDAPLYVYRVHGENSWLLYNAEIQANCLRIYDQYIEGMALLWAKRRGLFAIDLSGRQSAQPGYLCIDDQCGPNDRVHCLADLNEEWPFGDSTVGVVRAHDVFARLADREFTMRELHRVLAPGAMAFIWVASTDGAGAFQDPRHRSYWNQNSFSYYAGARAKYIDRPVRFQAPRLFTSERDAEGVCFVRADLVKVTEDMRVYGRVDVDL